jgi:hypothetical protein
MSIKPIDLQTLFMHMNQVGRDQAQLKQGLHLQQIVAGSELVRETEQKDSSVNQTNPLSDGPEQIHEDDEEQRGGRKRRKSKEEKKEPREESRNYYSDPDLGKKIDISG